MSVHLGFDPSAGTDRTAVLAHADGTVRVLVRVVDRVTPALRALRATFQRFGKQTEIASRALRRSARGPRSGNRHRGTVAWRLRYAPASTAPLGQRTAEKIRRLDPHRNQARALFYQPAPPRAIQPWQREVLRRSVEVTPTGEFAARTLTLR